MSPQARQDVALAIGVAALGQVDVLAPGLFSTHLSGPRWAISVCYLVTALALAWRRSRPAATFAVVAGVNAAQALLLGASEGNGVLFPALIATYSVAAHAPRRPALLALASLPALVAVRELTNPQNSTWHETVNALGWDLLLPAAWLLGAYLRTRRLYVDELRGRAAAAEREREERARTAVAEERSRIARELHDVIAHSVSVMVVQAEAAEEVVARDPARAITPLRTIQGAGRDALTELRRLLGVLREDDVELAPQPDLAELEPLLERVRAAGLEASLQVRGTPQPLGAGVGLAAYRIVQEGLTNVLKHAGARRVQVVLDYTAEALALEIRDDGRGTDSSTGDPLGGGHGLLGMRERVHLYRGSFEAGPAGDGGFVVRARLPLDAVPA
ncbi:MAG TPA: histidine kinase [Candidatus Eisenbacteria bacterium]|nr:histidine kinase [Candidatus Eisenbacteria bacterium]